MTSRSQFLIATALAALVGAAIAWRGGTPNTGAPDAPRTHAESAAESAGMSDDAVRAPARAPLAVGTIRGIAKLADAAGEPERLMLNVTSDAAMLERTPDGRLPDAAWAWNDDRSLPNVFVGLIGFDADPERWPVPDEPVVFENPDAELLPHVQGARVGQLIVVKSGMLGHPISMRGRRHNETHSWTPPGATTEFRLEKKDRVNMTCGVHSWMSAWVIAIPHPFFAVTSAEGQFEISGVPVGVHRIQAWHETFGRLTLEVTVRADEATDLEFVLPGRW